MTASAAESIVVTGGAGFIGSNFVLAQVRQGRRVVNLDKLTYAGNLGNLREIQTNLLHTFAHGSILDAELLARLFAEHQPTSVVHLAAESHVDRSIHDPETFVQTNVTGTFRLLQASLAHWRSLPSHKKDQFRFLHISTDEVFGSLEGKEQPFTEETPYRPNSPYAASKAASDHLVRSFHHTYGMPAIIANCSNNYGPRQFPEKLIPLMILNARDGVPLPVYGDGLNVRDWLYVEDHCRALELILWKGRIGESYNIGGSCEKTNLEVVNAICAVMDALQPRNAPHAKLIRLVTDRPGHDRRYAMDCRKIEAELGWKPRETFDTGIRRTVQWYIEHGEWVEQVTSGEYQKWISQNYALRSTGCGA